MRHTLCTYSACQRRGAMLLLSVVALMICHAAIAADNESISFQQEKGKTLTARYGDQVLWQFNYSSDLAKPFFHPVATTRGGVLTWNSPPDHPWHHALWFSWKYINGVNYWEADRKTGKSEGQTRWDDVTIKTNAHGTAVIRIQLTYQVENAKPVLRETRTITISPPEQDGSYHFDWQSVFTAGDEKVVLDRTPLANEPGGKMWGGYAGLSVRFAKELKQREATTDEGPVTFGPQSRYRGKASAADYAGEIGGKLMGIAICDHPQNLNHPSPWYAIRSKPMSYINAAVLCYGPHALAPGEHFTLRYRVIVHHDKWSADRLTKEYERFVADQK